jgi:hypothetical protein
LSSSEAVKLICSQTPIEKKERADMISTSLNLAP